MVARGNKKNVMRLASHVAVAGLDLLPEVIIGSRNWISMSFQKQAPSEFLKQIIGKPVVVKLNSGVDYRGIECLVLCGVVRSN